MKVKTYIGLLSAGSLGGAILVGLFGWWMLTSINQSTKELEKESKNSGASSSEYQDIQAFLASTRAIFEALEIYPDNYQGVFGVAKDRLSMSKEALILISQKYFSNYPEEIVIPIERDLIILEESIIKMTKLAVIGQLSSTKGRTAKEMYSDAHKSLSQRY